MAASGSHAIRCAALASRKGAVEQECMNCGTVRTFRDFLD
jgi:hypothetical protein